MRKVLKSLVSLLVIATMLLSMASVSFASNAGTPGAIILSTDGIKEVTFGDDTFTGVVVTVNAQVPAEDFYAGWDEGKVEYDNTLFDFAGMEPLDYSDGANTFEWTLSYCADNAAEGVVKVAIGIGDNDGTLEEGDEIVDVEDVVAIPYSPDGEPIGMVNLYFKVKADVVVDGQEATFTPYGSLVYWNVDHEDWKDTESMLGTMPTEREGITFTLPEAAPAEYTITYIVDGEEYAKDTYVAGAAIVLPEAPSKEGFTFVGWDEFPADGVMPESDVTVEAVFEEIPVAKYTVTYVIDGETVGTQEYEEGATITAAEAPSKEGFTFDGWTGLPADMKMPAEDITVTGSYTEVVVSETSGSCGTNATWALDLETGVLTISGTGAMTNYTSRVPAPWTEYCDQITSVTIADGITTIGDHSLKNIAALKEITLPESITKIGVRAFYTTGLVKITMPLVESVGDYAFYNCNSLKTVIASGTKDELFAMDFSTTTNGSNNSLLRASWTVTDGDNILYASMHGDARWIYDEKEEKLSVVNSPSKEPGTVIMTGYDKLGGYNFTPWKSYLEIAKEIEVEGIQKIVGDSFRSSPTLKTIVIGDGTTEIYAGAFAYSNNVETIYLPATLSKIGAKSFYLSPENNLKKVIVDMTLEEYKNVTLDGNNAKFMRSLFEYTDAYSGFHSNQTWWELDKESKVLTLINADPSITKMNKLDTNKQPWYQFKDDIEAIVVADDVTQVAGNAFRELSNVKSITFAPTVKYIEASSCRALTSLTEVVIPNNIYRIGTSAFYGCSNLETVVIPKSVKKIEASAFSNCGIKTVKFEGTQEEWNALINDSTRFTSSGNNPLKRSSNTFEFNYNYDEVVE